MGGANSRSTAVVAPEVVLRRLALASAVGGGVLALAAHDRSPLLEAVIALGAMTLLAMLLSRRTDDSWPRAAGLVAIAVVGVPLGYFFGPNSAYAAVLALLLAVTGLVSAKQPGLRSRTGWLVLIVVCVGQLAIMIAVLYGGVEDRSLAPILIATHERWHGMAAHLLLQAVYVSSFLAGRAAQLRYHRLVVEAIDASRSAAIREALLDEARADYERALALQARGDATTSEHTTTPGDGQARPARDAEVFVSGPTTPVARGPGPERTELVTVEPTTHDVERAAPSSPAPARRSVAVIDDGSAGRVSQALQTKLRMQDLFLLAVCLAGVLLAAVIVRPGQPRTISLVAILAITGMVALRAVLVMSRPNALIIWPYPVIAVLSAGPAYGFGLHSGFAAIVAMVLFTSELFRTSQPRDTRFAGLVSICAVCLGHGAVFALVMTGVLPDETNLPVKIPHAPAYVPYVHHAMVQGIYIVAFVASNRIDRELAHAYGVVREAYAAAARADAHLRVARSELDAALATEGLYTGTEVGPYQLGRLLGRGGMGEVYQAEHDGRRVALKVLRADRLGDPVALERFRREATLLATIDSAYCARILDVSGDRAVPYLAMEYVDGPSLSAVLRERGRLDAEELIALVDDLARGLADVHAKGVVHLDLKPSNVLRDSSRGVRWKIVDFGVARSLTGDVHRKVAGTPPYMAPEQALGEPIDTRTDLYSLALILYRAITGRPAYVGSDAVVIANRARTIGPPDPREVVTIEDDLAIVLRIGLAARVADRFADTTELRSAFVGAFGGRLDPRIRARGRELLARAPWALDHPAVSGPLALSSRRST